MQGTEDREGQRSLVSAREDRGRGKGSVSVREFRECMYGRIGQEGYI